jgi:hypothetical protein
LGRWGTPGNSDGSKPLLLVGDVVNGAHLLPDGQECYSRGVLNTGIDYTHDVFGGIGALQSN